MRDYHLPGRSPVYATHGMAATSMPAATLTALDVLRAGGNALDAAVAACAVLCVIEPQSTGIGGDCFCLYAPAGAGKVVALNGSGRAPAAATIDWYERPGHQPRSRTPRRTRSPCPARSSAWETLLKAHGRKDLDELLQPAIRYAEDGWPVHPKVAWDWKRLEPKLRKNGAHHFLPGGMAPDAGRHLRAAGAGRDAARDRAARRQGVLRRPDRRRHGRRPCARSGGLHTEEDFAAGLAIAEFVEPISLNWRGYDVYRVPAERPGHRRADDPGHAGRAADGAGRPAGHHPRAPPYRGGAAGLSRPRRLRCRPVAGRRAGAEAAQPGVPRRRCAP